jgi:hypothetical protein
MTLCRIGCVAGDDPVRHGQRWQGTGLLICRSIIEPGGGMAGLGVKWDNIASPSHLSPSV